MADLKTAGIADNLIFFDNIGETPGRGRSVLCRCESVLY